MITFPNAKINLGLNVVNRRSDGYHNIETIFYPVVICDALEIIEDDELSIQTSGIPIPGYPDENICFKALELLRKDFTIPNVKIHLHKNIPIGAGLGGGSSDAAFFVQLLVEKFELNVVPKSIENYCRQLGSDCAFFIRNQPVFATGKGDEFEDVKVNLKPYFLVLVVPDVHISTAEAYKGVIPTASVHSLKESINLPIEDWKLVFKNDFEESVFKNHPKIKDVKEALYTAGAIYASMSGSGSAVYGIFKKVVSLLELENKYRVFYNI